MPVIIYDINLSIAVILALIGVILVLTILNEKLRSQPQLWYVYHLLAVTTFIAFVIHTISHGGFEHHSTGVCLYVAYTTEYLFQVVGVNKVLINMEVYFTSMLPWKQWQSRPFLRFTVLILTTWIFVCLFVAHAVIANNGLQSNNYYCFYTVDISARTTRFIVRSGVPAIMGFLFTIAFIVTYILKTGRVWFISSPRQRSEVTSVGSTNDIEWLRFIMFSNGVFIVRTVIMCIFEYQSHIDKSVSYYYDRSF